jgi:hypothetical protein|tara:strand:- start:443 stop:562 length:120 start_codon:yes stop_codon:yes gene_type:complete
MLKKELVEWAMNALKEDSDATIEAMLNSKNWLRYVESSP